jgi:hypothetical protein
MSSSDSTAAASAIARSALDERFEAAAQPGAGSRNCTATPPPLRARPGGQHDFATETRFEHSTTSRSSKASVVAMKALPRSRLRTLLERLRVVESEVHAAQATALRRRDRPGCEAWSSVGVSA